MCEREWVRDLRDTLPGNFDWYVIHSVDDVKILLERLTRDERPRAAYEIYSRRNRFRDELTYAAMMEAWRGDAQHRGLAGCFGSQTDFAAALHSVAPKLWEKGQLTCYRGVSVEGGINPRDCALGIAWTRDPAIACWFATKSLGNPIGRPFVFEVTADSDAIITFDDSRKESEVLIDPSRLTASSICIEGTNISSNTLDINYRARDDWVASWKTRARQPGYRSL